MCVDKTIKVIRGNNCGEKIFHTEVDAIDDYAKDGRPGRSNFCVDFAMSFSCLGHNDSNGLEVTCEDLEKA